MTLKIDSNGVQIQTLQEILDERQSNLLSVFGEDFAIDRTSPIGNMELSDANNEQLIHECVAYLASQLSSETAEGYFLDCICEYNNIYRFPSAKSLCDFKIIGTPNTSITAEDLRIKDESTGAFWILNEDITIGSTGEIEAQFINNEYGPISNNSTNIITIMTPLSGITSVSSIENNNLIIGRYAETDKELRNRRREAIQSTGAYSLDNIRSSIFTLDGIIDCKYLENYNEVEKDGLPPKSFEIIVDGGDEDEIVDIIFEKKTLGVKPFGSSTYTREDSQGNKYEIGYTKAQHVNTKFTINITTSGAQTDAWTDSLKSSIVEKFDEVQKIAVPVKAYTYYTVLTDIGNIDDIQSVKIEDINDETHTKYDTLDINTRQIAKLSKDNIDIIFNN